MNIYIYFTNLNSKGFKCVIF